MAKLNKFSEDYELGILLVHGIGSQVPGETLVKWSDVLLKTIYQATGKKVKPIAHHSIRDEDDCAQMVIQLETGGAEEKWLVAEGYWADSFLPPSYAELVSWSIRAIPWTLQLHTAKRYWNRYEKLDGEKQNSKKWRMKSYALGLAVTEIFLTLTLAPIAILLLLISLLLGLLPVPQIRSIIQSAQGILVGSVGDSLAFVESPMRASLIRTRLLERLHALNTKCKRTVVVAHSQGAAVVLDAFGGIPEPRFGTNEEPYFKALPKDLQMPDALITFGAGTNQLASLKVLSSGPSIRLGMNPATYGMISFLLAIGIFSYVYFNNIPYVDLFYASAFVLPGYALFILLKYPVKMFNFLFRKFRVGQQTNSLAEYTAMLFIPLIYVTLFSTTPITTFPVYSSIIVIGCVIVLINSVMSILSIELKSFISITRKPPGLTRWVDIYASADPVSNGATNVANGSEEPEKVPVWNFGTMYYDHTSYWQNTDGFVLRVIRICATTAESSWLRYLPQNQNYIDALSKFRTLWLRIGGRMLALIWLVIGARIWTSHRQSIPRFDTDSLSWVPFNTDTLVQFFVVVAFVITSLWLTYNLMRMSWLMWVRQEQKIVLQQGEIQKNSGIFPFTGMIMVLGTVLILAYVVFTKTSAEIGQIRLSFENLKEFVFILAACSLLFHFICFFIKRKPVESPPVFSTVDTHTEVSQ